jgi:hypothetical protein
MTWLPWVPWMDVYLVALWVATAAQTAFTVALATTRWWAYRTGRALFIKALVLAVLLALSLVGWYRPLPHILEIGASLMCVMAAAVIYLLWSVLRQKWLDRRP